MISEESVCKRKPGRPKGKQPSSRIHFRVSSSLKEQIQELFLKDRERQDNFLSFSQFLVKLLKLGMERS